jgi:AcrR family transcriptional regulator
MATSRRDYDSSSRKALSDATRQRILDVTRESMVEHGYRATRIADVAAAADVHVATVYELVGRKPVILRELIERAISGADRAVPADERDYVVAMRAEPSPRRKLELYAAAMRDIQARVAPLLLALRDAATTEPDAAAVWREISDRRAANMRRLVAELADAGGVRADLSIDDAADFVWATNSAEVYVLMTTERGWTPERYEAWLADLWCRYLLPDDSAAHSTTSTSKRSKTVGISSSKSSPSAGRTRAK